MGKNSKNIILLLLLGGFILGSCNGNKTNKPNEEIAKKNNNSKMMHNMKFAPDKRIALNPSPQKAHHQLMNMRNHLKAVQSIINYLSKDEFDSASVVASSKLGLTDEMEMMCSSFGNKGFEQLGLGFHKSADRMSAIIKTKNKNKALKALSVTLNYCVTCHSTFKQ